LRGSRANNNGIYTIIAQLVERLIAGREENTMKLAKLVKRGKLDWTLAEQIEVKALLAKLRAGRQRDTITLTAELIKSVG